ncbi:ankyrin [Neocallimastix lanati (nom. inval.)]|nr:ankyrin [Neocallimastix sp. JGI-2020a]
MFINNNGIKKNLEKELILATDENNIKEVKRILEDANENKIVLNLNKKIKKKWYPLLYAISNNNIEMANLLIKYANNNKIVLKINEKNNHGDNSLTWASSNNNIKMVKLLIDYANKNNIILEINEKTEKRNNPLILATSYNNNKIVKLLINYANKNKIVLEINEKHENGNNPILWTIVQIISRNLNFVNLKNISEINPEFIKLIYIYRNKNIIEVVFSENSYILKKIVVKQLEQERRARRNNIMNRKNTNRDEKDTYLTYECQQGNIEEVKKLIHQGIDINEKNKDGDTPLLIACKNCNIELVKCLLNY